MYVLILFVFGLIITLFDSNIVMTIKFSVAKCDGIRFHETKWRYTDFDNVGKPHAVPRNTNHNFKQNSCFVSCISTSK